ncbi:MAG: hypothetical protein HC893_02110 [Chloroflexaceae bacterium]|nr:hypothetical protein [Chloroflexaceae bacterium]
MTEQFVEQLVSATTYDIPDVMIRETAQEMLEEQARQFAQYGITLDQMLQFRSQTRDDAIDDLREPAEQRLKSRLALQQIIDQERINVSEAEVQEEARDYLANLDESEMQMMTQALGQRDRSIEFLNSIANSVLDRKLRARLAAIATGEAPDLDALAAEQQASDEATDEPPTATAETADEPDEAASGTTEVSETTYTEGQVQEPRT